MSAAGPIISVRQPHGAGAWGFGEPWPV